MYTRTQKQVCKLELCLKTHTYSQGVLKLTP